LELNQSVADRDYQRFVILNLFQDNTQRWRVILKQVQDDDVSIVKCGAYNETFCRFAFVNRNFRIEHRTPLP
jgi:hypothetical protein